MNFLSERKLKLYSISARHIHFLFDRCIEKCYTFGISNDINCAKTNYHQDTKCKVPLWLELYKNQDNTDQFECR